MAKENTTTSWDADIHIVLAAKGGIGKTYICSLLAQYAASKGKHMRVLDLDQSNAMLSRVKSLEAERIELQTDAKFDTKLFDNLLRRMVTEPGPYLLDVGASTFEGIWRYFQKYKAIGLLAAQGRRVIIHSVIVGGPELPDTLNSFKCMCETVTGEQIVVWLNPVRGKILYGGKTFMELSVYEENESKVLAVVEMPPADEATMEELQQLTLKKQTLLTVEDAEDVDFISRHRLLLYRSELFDNIGDLWGKINGNPS